MKKSGDPFRHGSICRVKLGAVERSAISIAPQQFANGATGLGTVGTKRKISAHVAPFQARPAMKHWIL
jgi:hypothetical protein